MNKIPVVAIRSNDNCFLDILRCCGTAGIPVVPVVFTWATAGPWYSEYSRYYCNPVKICNPAEDEQASIAGLLDLGKKLFSDFGQRVVIIPSSDTSHVLIQKHFEELNPYYLQMGAADFSNDVYDIASKDIFCARLSDAGIGIPDSYPCLCADDIPQIVDAVSYPCIYKPVLKDTSNTFYTAHQGLKAVECSDKEMLGRLLLKEMKAGFRLIVQEKIVFTNRADEYSCYVYSDAVQKVRMISGQYKLDEYPKPYGTGFISKFHADPEVFAIAEKVVQVLKWRGFIGIEFMRDIKDGKWKIIEANLRPWLSIYFQASQGFNYIDYFYKDACGKLDSSLEAKTGHSDAENPVFRINFGVFWNKISNSSSATSLQSALHEWFKEHQGSYVFTNYADHDPQPGIKEIERMILKEDEPNKGILMLLLAFMKQNDSESRQV